MGTISRRISQCLGSVTMLFVCGSALAPARAGAAPIFVPLGYSTVAGLSSDGTTAGGAVVVPGIPIEVRPIRWTAADGIEELGPLPSGNFFTLSKDVSGDGSVVVGDLQTLSTSGQFRWAEADGFALLGAGAATGVSDDGTVVAGWAGTGSGATPNATRWTAATGLEILHPADSKALGISGDGSVIVGEASEPGCGRCARIWLSNGTSIGLGDLPGGATESAAIGASVDGSVVVGFASTGSGKEAFRWTSASGLVSLGDLPGGAVFAEARFVSDDGSVVVGNSDTASELEVFYWSASQGMVLLEDLLEARGVDLTGWKLLNARGLSGDGLTILGWGDNPDGNFEAFLVTLPEPSTALLVMAGLVGLARQRSA